MVQVEARAEVDVPSQLISEEQLDQWVEERQPRYLSTENLMPPGGHPSVPSDNPAEGIMQFRLSNGIKINARRTLNEPKAAMLRVIAAGSVLPLPALSSNLLQPACAILRTLVGCAKAACLFITLSTWVQCGVSTDICVPPSQGTSSCPLATHMLDHKDL